MWNGNSAGGGTRPAQRTLAGQGGVVLGRGVAFLLKRRGLGETEPIAIEEPD